jgi:hypothetical protein
LKSQRCAEPRKPLAAPVRLGDCADLVDRRHRRLASFGVRRRPQSDSDSRRRPRPRGAQSSNGGAGIRARWIGLFHLVDAKRAAPALDAIRRFMSDHNAVIMMVVLLIIGAKLLGDGLAVL